MTSEQKRILMQRIDAKRQKVPASAVWHMKHKPYQSGGDAIGDDKGEVKTIPGAEKGDCDS